MTEPRPRGRPRSARADEGILDAACDLTLERGWDAVGMEDVAKRAGVSKMTLYRRYPDKTALSSALIEDVVTAIPDDTELNFTPVRALLDVAARYYGSRAGRVALALLPVLQTGPGREAAARLATPRVLVEQARLLASDPDVDAEAVLNLALGAVVFYVQRHGHAPDAELLDRLACALE